jgi:glycosyltransferase involved in cell wall biosynthesis
MRIAHVITRLIVGGAQENTLASVLGLRKIPQVEVRLVSGPTHGPEGTLEPIARAQPGLFLLVPELVRPVHPWKDWIAFRKLTGFFRDFRPDLVHTHSGKAGVLGRLAARKARVPRIVHTIHGPSFGPFQGAIANSLFKLAERKAGRVTDHFVVVAEAMRDQYLEAGIGAPHQYTRIFSGFNLNPFLAAQNDLELRAQIGISPGDFVIGKIARLFKLKGHDDLFAAARSLVEQVPQAKFLLIGNGPWREKFESRAAELNMRDRFVFTGLVPPAEVPRLVGVMDVLVHLSLREGLARALPQALAAGRPVVAYDCDGAREVCLPEKTGFLIQPGDISGLVRSVARLACDPALRRALGEQGREMVRRNFPVEKMVNDLFELYQAMLQTAPKTPAPAT